MDLLTIFISIVVILYCIYLYLTWNYNYWKKRNLPHLPVSIGFGNIKDAVFMKRTHHDLHTEIYNKFSDYKYVGYYNLRQPAIFVRDLDLIKTILIKDFSHFNSNGITANEKNDPYMAKNPFVLHGERWKLVRMQIGPAMSSGRIKYMFPQMIRVSKRLVNFIANDPDNNPNGNGVFAKELCAKYTVDSVASCALSIDVKSFENPKSEFREMGRKILDSDNPLTTLKFIIIAFNPTLADLLGLGLVSPEIGKFFTNLIREQIEHRRKNNLLYNDFLDYMIDLQNKCTEYDFDEIHMASHIISFFTDGFETSSVAMSYILYEIAAHPEIQNRLREEIENVIKTYNGEITYEAVIHDMKYLDAVITETLRLRPPGGFLRKQCVIPYKFPPPKENIPGIDVEVGTKIIIPIYPIMTDPKYFVNPKQFDPDRYSDERKSEIVKGTVLAFGDGPRQCIGMRFALAQIKVGVVAIVRNFEIRVHSKTQQPLKDDPTGFMLKPVGGIWLTFHKRKV